MNSLVSIITPSYNSEKYIASTIESVLNQTYESWELIIIDDKSPDNANKIIESYSKKDNRIKHIKLLENAGPANARNKAISEAQGKYIAFLDSDDIWLPQKLEKQISLMEEEGLLLSYSAYHTIDENGTRINTRNVKEYIDYTDMLKSNHIGNLTGIYKCSELGKVYMDNVGHEDYTLWLKIMKKIGSTRGIVEPLAEYRVFSNSISANKFKAMSWTWNIYRNVVGLNLFSSSYYFLHYVYYSLKKRV